MNQAPLDIHIVTSDHSVKFTIECDERIAREVSCAVMALILRIVERPIIQTTPIKPRAVL